MNYGFITGLPRSGSAWMANYLSYGNSMFLHDVWKDNTPDEVKARVDSAGVLAGGVSDPSSLFFLKKIDKSFPDAKWVVVTRPPKEVEASCKAINFPFVDFTQQLKELINSRNVLKVPFVKMFDKADEIGRFLYEDWSCPSWRKEQLKSLNVQLHWGRVSDQFKVPEKLFQADNMTPNKMEYLRLLKEIVNSDPHAMRFMVQAQAGSELYKRLDQNLPIDVEKAKNCLEIASTEWLLSPFVRSYSASLAPAIMASLEKYRNDPTARHCPIDINLLTTVTYIFKGNDGVKEYMPKIRELSDKITGETNGR